MERQDFIRAFKANGLSLSFLLRKPSLSVVSFCVLGTVLRLPNLRESFWLDEVLYGTSYSVTSPYDLWHLFLYDAPAPLYRVFMFFWRGVFGENELAVRVPSLLFGIGSIVLTHGIASAYGSPRVAFLAALLLCFSPAHVWYSQEATPYAMALFFLLATIVAWRRLREEPTSGGWYTAYLSLLLIAVFTHYYVAVFLLPLTLLSRTVERSLRKRIIVAHAVVVSSLVLALSLKYLAGKIMGGQSFLRPFTLFEWWMLFFNWFLQGNALWTVSPYSASLQTLLDSPLFLACQIFFFAIFLRGFLSRRPEESRSLPGEGVLLTFSLPLVMFLLTQVGLQHLYIERYLLLVLPFFLIVLARGAASFSNARAVIACSVAAGVIGAAAYGAMLYKSERWTVYKQNPDWRSAASYLSAQNVPPQTAVALGTIFPVELVYYFRKEVRAPSPRVMRYDAKTFARLLSAPRLRAVYLIKNRYWVADFDKVLQQMKEDKRFVLANSQSFKGLDVYTFERS